MASFFKNLFRKDGDSQPVPAAPLTHELPDQGRLPVFQSKEAGETGARPSPAGGIGGPFSAVAARHMTARELASLLPPALLRFDGVSPDQPVPLPMEALRQSLQSGRPVLRLSQIQEACPMLFQRPLQAGEDVEITLPMARVKGLLEGAGDLGAGAPPSLPSSQFAPAPAVAAGNPFANIPVQTLQPAAATPSAPAAPPAASPFAPVGGPEGASPFAPASPPQAPFSPSPPSPFQPAASPFTPVPAAASLPQASIGHGPGSAGGPLPASFPPSGSPFAPAPGSPSAGNNPFNPAPSPFPIGNSPFAPVPAVPPAAAPSVAPASPFAAAFPSGASPAPTQPALQPVAAPDSSGLARPGIPSPFAPVTSAQGAVASVLEKMPSPFAAVVPTAPAPAAEPVLAPLVPAFPRLTPAEGGAPAPLAWPPAGSAGGAATSLPIQPRSGQIPTPRSAPTGTENGNPPVAPPAAALPNSPTPSAFAPLTPPPPMAGAPTLPPFQSLAPQSKPTPAPSLAPPPILTTPAPAPASFVPAAGAPTVVSEAMDLSLRAVLRDADPAQLGFAPENVPESVSIRLPVAMISKQLATGRVEVGIDDICAGISEKFRPAFARAVSGLRVSIPMSEVFHNLPESARPSLEPVAPVEGHLAITTSPFQTPFAIKAEEDSARQLLDLSVTGFNPVKARPLPVTLPVPPGELPHTPLPPVIALPSGGPRAVNVDLPVLRPVASAAPASGNPPPSAPRIGMLSRPPGSGTAPTAPPAAPRAAPRLKSVPISPTALRPFPKPAPPPASGTPLLPPAPEPVIQPPPVAEAPHAHTSPPPEQPLAEVLPPPLSALPSAWADSPDPLDPPSGHHSSGTDLSDDLGESFSAAKLSAEPPPRAGSVPVKLPPPLSASVPTKPAGDTSVLPVSFGETGPFLPDTSDFHDSAPSAEPASTAPEPVPVAGLAPDTPTWINGSILPSAPSAPQPPALPVAAIPTAPVIPDATAPFLSPIRTEAPALETAPPPSLPVAAPAKSVPAEDLTFGCITDIRQLTLRAVLGTDQALSPQDIVDRCAVLPGLKACVLFYQNSTVVSRGIAAEEAEAFHASAVKTRDSLTTLAETMGLGSGGNFTLRTDHGVRSFFLEADLCLAVWHDQPAFSGGTREKLILIAHELAKS